jgi:hypothetical protein
MVMLAETKPIHGSINRIFTAKEAHSELCLVAQAFGLEKSDVNFPQIKVMDALSYGISLLLAP